MNENKKLYADIHCHPVMKAYGKSHFERTHSPKKDDENCGWHRKKAQVFNKLLNEITGITKFTQSDYQTLNKGNVRVVCNSLYPLEKGFVASESDIAEFAYDYVMGIGHNRINYIQQHKNYFTDLCNEYNFLKELSTTLVEINGENYSYQVARNGADVKKFFDVYSGPGYANVKNTVVNIITIEGAHSLNCGVDVINHPLQDTAEIIANINAIKGWEHRPFFITFAHHFNNELCGHARSLHLPFMNKLKIDQEDALGKGINKFGKEVLQSLLDNSGNKRILIDIKHMSRQSRLDFFKFLETGDSVKSDFLNHTLPIVVSHGGVTGLKNENGGETIAGSSMKFMQQDINFYDEEIIKVAESGGLFGIQLDERRIASKSYLNDANTGDVAWHFEDWAKLLWRQVQHIAEVLDSKGMDAWNIQCIGSDFDGLINPIGPYWTAGEMPALEKNLVYCAKEYFKKKGNSLSQSKNKDIQPDEIVYKLLSKNPIEFIINKYN